MNVKEPLDKILETLTPREQRVLQLRFGLEDGRSRTLKEVGAEFNVTGERIRQVVAKALRKLRHRRLRDCLEEIAEESLTQEQKLLRAILGR